MRIFHTLSLFAGAILLPLFLEGIGVKREIMYVLVILLPLIFSIIMLYDKKEQVQVQVPYVLSWITVFFLISSVVSVGLSPNMQRSFEYTLYWVVIVLTMIVFSHVHTKQILKHIFYGLVILGFIFSIYAVFLKYVLPEAWSGLIPQHMHQYVADPFRTHNPLGVFLLIPLAMLLPSWRLSGARNERIAFVLLFGFLVFSYTRAAYATFTLMTLAFIGFEVFVKKRHLPKKIYIFLGAAIFVTVFLSFAIAWFSDGPEWYLHIHNFFVYLFGAPRYKGFISGRIHFGAQAIKGLMERPLFGWGPDNLFYASIKYTPITKYTTYVSENLFLDIFAEQGIIGGVLFSSIIGLLFWQSFEAVKNSRNILKERFFFALLAILILMMGDTIKRNYMLFLLFFSIGSVLYSERRTIQIPFKLLFTSAIVLLVFITFKINSQFFLALNKPHLAQILYPLNKDVYPVLINEADGHSEVQKRWSDLYLFFFPGDQKALITAGNTYISNNARQTLHYYMEAYTVSPLNDFRLVEGIYYLKKDTEGAQSAKEFLFAHIDKYLSAKKWAAEHRQHIIALEGNIMFLCGDEGYDCWFVYGDKEEDR